MRQELERIDHYSGKPWKPTGHLEGGPKLEAPMVVNDSRPTGDEQVDSLEEKLLRESGKDRPIDTPLPGFTRIDWKPER